MIAEERQVTHDEKVKQLETLLRKAQHMATKGYSNVAIARELGISESSVRTLLIKKTV